MINLPPFSFSLNIILLKTRIKLSDGGRNRLLPEGTEVTDQNQDGFQIQKDEQPHFAKGEEVQH